MLRSREQGCRSQPNKLQFCKFLRPLNHPFISNSNEQQSSRTKGIRMDKNGWMLGHELDHIKDWYWNHRMHIPVQDRYMYTRWYCKYLAIQPSSTLSHVNSYTATWAGHAWLISVLISDSPSRHQTQILISYFTIADSPKSSSNYKGHTLHHISNLHVYWWLVHCK